MNGSRQQLPIADIITKIKISGHICILIKEHSRGDIVICRSASCRRHAISDFLTIRNAKFDHLVKGLNAGDVDLEKIVLKN